MNYDYYGLIRSEEVREFCRKHWKMNAEQTAMMIHFSYWPVRKKYDLLKQLAEEQQDEKDRDICNGFVRVYDLVREQIEHPSDRAVYMCKVIRPVEEEVEDITEWERLEAGICDKSEYDRSRVWGVYDSLEELFDDFSIVPEEDPTDELFIVTQTVLPRGKHSRETADIYIGNVDGKNEIFRILPNTKWMEENGIEDDVIYDVESSANLRHPYPFPNYSRVLIQTPLMKTPLRGILDRELDGCGCWYNFIHAPQEIPGDFYSLWFLDSPVICANYANLEMGYYSTLDWISSDPEDEASHADDLERIIRSWRNIRYYVGCSPVRNNDSMTRADCRLLNNIACRLIPDCMEESGEGKKTLWLKTISEEEYFRQGGYKEDSDPGRRPDPRPENLIRLALEQVPTYEYAVKLICAIDCEVRITEGDENVEN